MIVVTGGAGFIGSAFVWKLNQQGIENIVIVDRLGSSDKWKNLVNLRYIEYIHKDDFLQMIYADQVPFTVRAVIHMGPVPPRRNGMPIISGGTIIFTPAASPTGASATASGSSMPAPPPLTATAAGDFPTPTTLCPP